MTDTGLMRAPASVLFGAGAAAAAGRVASPHGRRALVCTDDFFASSAALRGLLASLRGAGLEVEVLAAAEPELPLSSVEAAIAAAARLQPDCLIGLGGGSCLDLAKLVALGLSVGLPLSRCYGENAVPGPTLPVIALPTTAGTGSEVTPVAVLTDPSSALKVGVSSPHLVPRAAICDPLLSHGAPPSVSAHAGIDALAHAVEAYCAVKRPDWSDIGERVFVGRNAISDVFALRAIALIGEALPRAVADEPEAREAMALGSLCAGLAFGTAGTALAHALQYPIGARTGTSHGLGIGLLLPYTMAFNSSAVPERTAAIGGALGAGEDAASAIARVRELAAEVGIPSRLGEIGLGPESPRPIAAQSLTIARLVENNPRAVTEADLLALLEQAVSGDPEALIETTEEQ